MPMKIRILQKSETTLGVVQDEHIILGDICVADCCDFPLVWRRIFSGETGDEKFEFPCLLDSLVFGEKFFYKIQHFVGKDRDYIENGIGFIEKTEQGPRLNREKILNSQEGLNFAYSTPVSLPDGTHVIVTGSYPYKLSHYTNEPAILTSKGVMVLEENNLFTVKDGEIVEITPRELQNMLSKTSPSKSPSYSSIQTSPLLKRPARPKEGTIIFNKISKQLEVYTNKKWKVLAFKEDE